MALVEPFVITPVKYLNFEQIDLVLVLYVSNLR